MLSDLPPATITIDIQIMVGPAVDPSMTVDEMPPCLGQWHPLPEPLPPGSYGTVYTARVTQDVPRDYRFKVMLGGTVLAVLHWGETRNWTCIPGSMDLQS